MWGRRIMARTTVNGFELVDRQLARMDRGMIRSIVEAGARAAEKRMADNTRMRQHVRTGDMLDSIGTNEYREWMGGGTVDVYPQGEDRMGVRNATKAYVINYGKGKRPYAKRPRKNPRRNLTGDKFITGDERKTEEAVTKAMQAESDRLVEELNK